MIENESQLTKSDLEFIIRKSKFHKKNRRRTISLTIFTVLCYAWITVLAVLSAMIGKWDWWTLLCIGLGLGLGTYALLQLLIPEKLVRRKMLQHPGYRSPRHIVFDDEGAVITTDRGGMETTLRVGYDRIEGYFAADGVVYVRLITEEKGLYYVCVHDDGYTAGDRSSLTLLLEKHGVQQIG